jgi:hypothetical protein
MSERYIERKNEPTQIIEEAVKKIIPYQEYPKYHRRGNFAHEFEAGDRQLVFFASNHSVDKEHPQFKTIPEKFQKFVEASKRPKLVLVEGLPKEAFKGSGQELESYISQGEMMFTAAMAEKSGVEWDTPEPNEAKVVEELLQQGFKRHELAMFYIIRGLDYSLRTLKRVPSQAEFGKELLRAEIAAHAGWAEVPSMHEILEMYHRDPKALVQLSEHVYAQAFSKFTAEYLRMTGKEFVMDQEHVQPYADPGDQLKTGNQLNQTAAAHNNIRDREIVRRIGHELAAGKNLFVVYGSGHITTQEPAIRELWDKIVTKS